MIKCKTVGYRRDVELDGKAEDIVAEYNAISICFVRGLIRGGLSDRDIKKILSDNNKQALILAKKEVENE